MLFALITILEVSLSCSPIHKFFTGWVAFLFFIVACPVIPASQPAVDDNPVKSFEGNIEMGELVTREQSARRLLSQAVYARWER